MRQGTLKKLPPPTGGGPQHEQEFVYYDGEHPGWKDAESQGGHYVPGHAAAVQVSACPPLTMMQYTASPDALHEVRARVARLTRYDVIQRYLTAYVEGKRVAAGIMAVELIERGIPPCFWHTTSALDDATVEQRSDLVLVDLTWLRRWYPSHAHAVRYQRGKALLTGSEAVLRREAEFAFYQGKRPAWKIVGSLSMTERQQWDSAYLRSTPVKRHAEATDMISVRVQQVLYEDLQGARRTAAFTDADAQISLSRRYALWRCARMAKDGSPTEIATRYQQMTGMLITRQAAAKQLEKIRLVLRARGMTL